MKLKEKLADDECTKFGLDLYNDEVAINYVEFKTGFLAGFQKAQETSLNKIIGAIGVTERFTKIPNVGQNLKREHEFLLEHLETLKSIIEELGEEEV
jgi:hypothetical protein